MIEKVLFLAAVLLPGLAYCGDSSADQVARPGCMPRAVSAHHRNRVRCMANDDDLRDQPSDDKVVSLDKLAEDALLELKKDIAAAGKEIFGVQIVRALKEMREPWPFIENRAAGALGIGPNDIGRASLPAAYQDAKARLRECLTIDETQQWHSKAAAVATWARIAKDPELLNLAERVRLRAVRRCGELLREIKSAKPGRKLISVPPAAPNNSEGRFKAAAEAGLSRRQTVTALRVASVPADEFEQDVEAETPPSVSDLAERGRRPAARREPTIVEPTLISITYRYARGLTPEEIATERQLALLMHAWREAGPEARQRFIQYQNLQLRR
jgi:hypothetical protein